MNNYTTNNNNNNDINMIIENGNYNLKNLKYIKIKEKTQKKSFTDCANYLLEVIRKKG
jgi:hypothetical protein